MNEGGAEVVRRLDILIRLVAAALCEEDWPQKKKIAVLSSAGLSAREIAEFLGTTPNTVSVAISNLKRDKSAGRPKKPTEGANE